MIHGDILGERARLIPEAEALLEVKSGRRFSYGELNRRALKWAGILHALGLSKGDRLALLSGNRVEFIDVFFGAIKAGIILVPLNTHLAAFELEEIIRDAGPCALIYDGQFNGVICALHQRVPVENWIALDSIAVPGDRTAEALLNSVDSPIPFQKNLPDELCALLYTSGTTGSPKGVMIPHRMLAWNGYNTVVNWQLRSDDVSPIFTPLYHAGGLGAFLIPLFTVGGRIVLHSAFDSEEVWNIVEKEGCTVILGVPAIWKMLAKSPALKKIDVSHVRWLISGGAPLPPSLVETYRRHGLVLRQGYGLTEVGVNCFAMTDKDAWERPGSIGKPLMFTQARLVDDSGNDVERGEVGELLLKGPHVSSGYWHNPDETALSYDPEGFFHTGDLAREDEDGFFYISGRRKEMFISGGVNIYPAEIEALLSRHPAISDCAVVGVPHEKWGEVGAAFLVLAENMEIKPDEVIKWLEKRIARYKVPKHIVVLDKLPRTAYGKVLRAALVERFSK
ncbi:MAG: hypothetical protein DRJ08_00920 [Acidobacteria bacterium]|nr:MAG: hypothetical protein DRJ14_08430 [Acidobacteriota bacterium]RLE24430.1 MAG: hypothetical protein DRJ08_00920 [Acidobacteriota bacterium]